MTSSRISNIQRKLRTYEMQCLRKARMLKKSNTKYTMFGVIRVHVYNDLNPP